ITGFWRKPGFVWAKRADCPHAICSWITGPSGSRKRFGTGNLKVKSKKGNRLCEISAQLVEHLRGFLRTWRPNKLDLLFASGNGTPWDGDTVRSRKLYPLLEKLGIEKCGFHAFRHGNETVMDGENVPWATRLNRLGHSDPKVTMRYTHVVS